MAAGRCGGPSDGRMNADRVRLREPRQRRRGRSRLTSASSRRHRPRRPIVRHGRRLRRGDERANPRTRLHGAVARSRSRPRVATASASEAHRADRPARRGRRVIASSLPRRVVTVGVARSGVDTRPQDFSADYLRAAVEPLRRLATDHIDVYQLHGPKVVARGLGRAGGPGGRGQGRALRRRGRERRGCRGVAAGGRCRRRAGPVRRPRSGGGGRVFRNSASGRSRSGPVACSAAVCSARDRARPGGDRRTTEGSARSRASARSHAATASGLDELAIGFVRSFPQVSTVLLGISSPEHLRRNLDLWPPLRSTPEVLARCGPRPRASRGRPEPDADVVVIGSGPTGAMAAAPGRSAAPTSRCWTPAPRAGWARRAGRRQHVFRREAGPTAQPTVSARGSDPGRRVGVEPVARRPVQLLDRGRAPLRSRDFTEGARLDERYGWPVTYDELDPHYEHAEALRVTAGGPIRASRRTSRRHATACRADWREIVDDGDRPGTASACCRWPRAPVDGRPPGQGVRQLPLRRRAPARRRRSACRGALERSLLWPGRAAGSTPSSTSISATGRRRSVRAAPSSPPPAPIDSTVLLLRSPAARLPERARSTPRLVGRYLHDHPREWWVGRRSTAHCARSSIPSTSPVTRRRAAADVATSLTIGLSQQLHRLRTYFRGSTRRSGYRSSARWSALEAVSPPSGTSTGDAGEVRPTITFATTTRTSPTSRRHGRGLGVIGRGGSTRSRGAVPRAAARIGRPLRRHGADAPGPGLRHPRRGTGSTTCQRGRRRQQRFTTGPEKNPTLTAMALAGRAADRLGGDIRDGTI